MLVSAIIPCYNSQATIGRAITSLLTQTVAIDQIIVINDGSTDESLQVVQDLQQKHSSIIVIDQENKGVCAARNAGIEQAKGTYLLTLDADDYFEDTFVEKALKKFEEDDRYGAVMCGYVRVVNGKKILPYIPEEITFESCLLRNGAIACLLLKKEAVLKAGLYDLAMSGGHEDWDLNIRVLKLGYRYAIIPEVLFNYVDTVGSRSYTSMEQDLDLKMQLFHKYRDEYKKLHEYLFIEFSKEISRLQRQIIKIKRRKSFRVSEKIISQIDKIKSIFK